MLQQSFLPLDLPAGHFDGVFANAALFHVPSQELPRVLAALRQTLKPGGVLFSSNPNTGHLTLKTAVVSWELLVPIKRRMVVNEKNESGRASKGSTGLRWPEVTRAQSTY